MDLGQLKQWYQSKKDGWFGKGGIVVVCEGCLGDFLVQNMHRFRTCLAMVEMISQTKKCDCSEFGADFWLRSCVVTFSFIPRWSWTDFVYTSGNWFVDTTKGMGLGKIVSPASNMAIVNVWGIHALEIRSSFFSVCLGKWWMGSWGSFIDEE